LFPYAWCGGAALRAVPDSTTLRMSETVTKAVFGPNRLLQLGAGRVFVAEGGDQSHVPPIARLPRKVA